MRNSRSRFCAAALMVAFVGWAVPAEAMAPPVGFALQTIGEDAEDRRQRSWSVTRVDAGVSTHCGEVIEEEEGIVPSTQMPWNMVWAVLWSDNPEQDLSNISVNWGDRTSRIEVFDGAPVFCYGIDSKLCIDEEVRRIVVLDIEVDQVRWRLQTTGDGDGLQITKDSSLVARLRTVENCD